MEQWQERTYQTVFKVIRESSVLFNGILSTSRRYFKLGKEGLRELSLRENLKLRDSTIDILVSFAENSISKPRNQVEVFLFLPAQKLDRFKLLNEQIKVLEQKIEDLFNETEVAVLLTVPGIGIVTGAELYAEMGDISDFDHAGQLIKLAGTNPTVKQSGGHRPTYYGIPTKEEGPLECFLVCGRSMKEGFGSWSRIRGKNKIT